MLAEEYEYSVGCANGGCIAYRNGAIVY